MGVDDLNRFKQVLHALNGLECWSITAGIGTGTVLLMSFGKRIPQKKPIDNSCLTEEQRNFEGEYKLFVTSFWRIDSLSEVVRGCLDESEGYEVGGPTLSALDRITNQIVTQVVCDEPSLDLKIKFENGLWLNVFCLEPHNEDSDRYTENYHLADLTHTYCVLHGSLLEIEPRDHVHS